MLEYCQDNDGYSIQHQNSYHSMQMQDDYPHSPHAGMPMKPPPQYTKPNMMMYNGSYGSHQDGFSGKKNYPNGYHGQYMPQTDYSGSAFGTNGYHMSHASMGGKPPYHHMSHASMGSSGGGGYNTMMMSSSTDNQYDYNYNKVRPRPTRMPSPVMEYEHGNWGNGTNGYHYSNQIVNCMPYGYNSEDQWIAKSLPK